MVVGFSKCEIVGKYNDGRTMMSHLLRDLTEHPREFIRAKDFGDFDTLNEAKVIA